LPTARGPDVCSPAAKGIATSAQGMNRT